VPVSTNYLRVSFYESIYLLGYTV